MKCKEACMQLVWAGVGDQMTRLELPDPDEAVMPGVRWGRPEEPMTPAYWAVRCRWGEASGANFVTRTGSLIEEVAFCLLGGFGITYEVNAAAFERLKSAGAFDEASLPTEAWLLEQLTAPLNLAGRAIRYRFPRQRARRLALMRGALADLDLQAHEALALRERLLALEGVGPKTASWIVRNLLGSDEVAILDIHVLRACSAMAIFPEQVSLPKDYEALEQRFLRFASAIKVRASILDAVMWTEMRSGRSPLAA
jgi:thermostable 8-oxoguanine DNA glycosylase